MSANHFERRRLLKKKFNERKPIFAGWTSLGDPQITEIFTHVGFDFIGIDIEHSTIDYKSSQRIIAASQAYGSLCLPRIDSHDMAMIKRLLDSGADGIIAPMVETASEASRLLEWIKYSPSGKRSFGINRAQAYGFEFEDYVKEWNQNSIFIVQIESLKGVKNINEILACEGVDGAMIGPYDLSGSMGIPGQIEHPELQAAALEVIKACAKYNKTCGSQVVDYSLETLIQKNEIGYNFLVLSSDIFLMWKWAQQNKDLIHSYLSRLSNVKS